MRRYRSLGELPLGGTRRVVAIGTFDGIHAGHQAIIAQAVATARERGLPAMVVTFSPNPITVLRPELRTSVLTGPGLKAALIAQLGVDELLTIPFNRSFARVRAERFSEMLAGPPIGADAVVVGEGFRFGHGGAGTVSLLRDIGRARGVHVDTPSLVSSADGKPISSTRVRRLVSQGMVTEVAELLGRWHSVEGHVVRGAERGRTLGTPTANISPIPPDAAIPGRGVYAGVVVLSHGREPAAINVGVAPTFGGDGRSPLRIEAHLLDYKGGDLYDQPARVEFVRRIRDERKFDSGDALARQIADDIVEIRAALAATGEVSASLTG